MNGLILYLAQGFGAGRIPWAPGTWGSLVGLLWTVLLVATGSFWLYLAGTAAGLALSVWICGRAERLLGQKDPGSIVLDEIAALPVCFVLLLGVRGFGTAGWPDPGCLFSAPMWPWTLGIFAAFRIFDILKPWPVRQSQNLSGGWGVTADDLLAALYVCLLTVPLALR